jgi:mono/diheme cytochrome c family protein
VDSSVARSDIISRLLFGTSILVAVGAVVACSDRDAAGRPAAEDSAPHASSPAEPNAVLPPEGADLPEPPDRPPADEIARASATDLAREPNHVDWSGGHAAHGQALFATHCALCHGGAGAGDGLATPALNPKPRDFRDGRFYIDANANNRTGEDVDLARVILYGPAAFGGSPEMVAWKETLSETDVRDLIAYIRTLATAKKTEKDAVAPRAGAS